MKLDWMVGRNHAVVTAHVSEGLDAEAMAAAEPILLQAASSGATPWDVRRLAGEIRYRTDPDGSERDGARLHERRRLAISELLAGSWRIDGTLDPASGLVVKTAVDAFCRPTGAADTRTARQRRADGLAAACKAALDAGVLPERHGVRPHVNLVVEQTTLAGAPQAPPATSGYRAPLTRTATLGLTCDATVSTVGVDPQGVPLSVGRAARVITPALRRAVEARDQGCRWPGCDQPAVWCSPHHIRHWADGGTTSLDNLVLLCWVHHQGFVHARGWTVSGDPNSEVRLTAPKT